MTSKNGRSPLGFLPDGFRAALPLLLPTAAIGISFGLVAGPQFGAIPAMVMSALVWSGTAQFAASTAIASGGGAVLAATTGLLANARFLPMGFAIAPSMTSGPARRAAVGALVADASFILGHRFDGTFDIRAIAWAAVPQYVGWVGGTIVGVLGAGILPDPGLLGLDALFPVFYLSLLLPELRAPRGGKVDPTASSGRRRTLAVAGVAAVVTLALTPVVPAGIPVLAAAAVALVGLRRPR